MIFFRQMFKKIEITPEEKKELEQFITEICDLGYEKFEEIKPNLPWTAQKIMKFFTLPKTELHARYLAMIAEPAKLRKQKRLEEKLRDQMRQGRSDFIDEHCIEEHNWKDVKYKLISCKTYRHHLTWETEQILHLAIPFEYSRSSKARFGYWVLVSNLKTPTFFETLLDQVPKYSGTPEVYSNKE